MQKTHFTKQIPWLVSCKKGHATGSNIAKTIFWWNYFVVITKIIIKIKCSKGLFCNNFGQDDMHHAFFSGKDSKKSQKFQQQKKSRTSVAKCVKCFKDPAHLRLAGPVSCFFSVGRVNHESLHGGVRKKTPFSNGKWSDCPFSVSSKMCSRKRCRQHVRNASEMRQKMRQIGSCFIGKRGTFQNASKMRGTPLRENTFWTIPTFPQPESS